MSANNKNNKSAFLIGWCRFQEQWWWGGLLLTQRHYVLSTSKSSWKLGKYQNTADNNTMLSSTLVSASSLCIDVGDWHSWQLGVVGTRTLERARTIQRLKAEDNSILDQKAYQMPRCGTRFLRLAAVVWNPLIC
ncbi:hypothetical protein ACA910_008742 [Epithemia clementina (nom. ined.)]